MATVVRNVSPSMAALAPAFNALKAQIGAGSSFHLDASEETVTAANASDLPTSLVLCNQLAGVLKFHFADTLAHKAADTTDGGSLPVVGAAVDLASAETAANSMKTLFDTHIASTSYHYNADATNSVSATPNATDQTSLNTLLNAMKTAVNAHMASAPAAASLRLVSA